MSTALDLDLDIAALVGEMPAEPCESATHDPADQFHDDGPATHYARVHCPNCHVNGVKGYCQRFTDAIQSLNNYTLRCFGCGHVALAEDMATILGPVGRLS